MPGLRTFAKAARERRVLVESLLFLESSRPRLVEAVRAGVRWKRVLDAALRNGIAPYVYEALFREGLADLLDPEVLGSLQSAATQNAARNQLFLSEALRIQGVLREQGIESLAMKGAGLIAAIPDLARLRYMSDIDLLLRPDDVPRAVEVLSARGYQCPVRTSFRGERLDPAAEVAGGEFNHLPPVTTPGGVGVELHSRPPYGDASRSDVEPLFARSEVLCIRGRNLRVPCLADQRAITSAHVWDHHDGHADFVPRHLADVHAFEAGGATAAAVRALHGVRFDEALRADTALLESANRGGISAVLPGRAEARFSRVGALLERTIAGPAAQVRNAVEYAIRTRLSSAFPARQWMAERYGVRPGSGVRSV